MIESMARTIDKLSAIIAKILKSRGMQSRLREYRISGQWARIVGPAIALHAQPSTLRGDRLMLIVDSPAWMQQLSLMRPEIIEKLNNTLGAQTVREITLKLGEIISPPMQSRAGEGAAREITAEERDRIELYVRDIADSEIREAMRRLIEKDLLRKKGDAGR
jgi:hypothetical protein